MLNHSNQTRCSSASLSSKRQTNEPRDLLHCFMLHIYIMHMHTNNSLCSSKLKLDCSSNPISISSSNMSNFPKYKWCKDWFDLVKFNTNLWLLSLTCTVLYHNDTSPPDTFAIFNFYISVQLKRPSTYIFFAFAILCIGQYFFCDGVNYREMGGLASIVRFWISPLNT